jgi:hypothetical protein
MQEPVDALLLSPTCELQPQPQPQFQPYLVSGPQINTAQKLARLFLK